MTAPDSVRSVDIVVVGGGVIGSASAYYLARAGLSVLHVERARPAAGASGASAGGVRQQARDVRELPLAMFSIGLWSTLEEALEADVRYRREGHITLVEHDEDLPGLQERVRTERGLGLDIRVADQTELRELVPGISPAVVAGSFCPSDGHADPTATTQAFATAAIRHSARAWRQTRLVGITVEHERVVGVRTSRGSVACGWVVDAAGAWADRVAAMAGVTMPLSAQALQMIETQVMPPILKPVLGSVRRPLSLKQVPGGRFLIGGGYPGRAHLERFAATTLPASVSASPSQATAVLPALSEARMQRSWAGLEAFTSDGIPVIEALAAPRGLVVAAGFCGHGFALAPGVGVIVQCLVTGEPLPIDLTPFRLERLLEGASRSNTDARHVAAAKARS